jgi:peptidyl-prolyl cis-trans isomerase C
MMGAPSAGRLAGAGDPPIARRRPSMRLAILAGYAAVLLAAAPARAEEDPVVAIVNGAEIHRSQVVESAQSLPQEYQQNFDQIFPALLERLVSLELLAAKGREANLQDDPEVTELMAAYETEAIRHVYIQRLIDAEVTEEKIKAEYDRYVAANPPQTEVRARHILVATKEEAEAIVAALDGGAKFEELAKQKSTDPAAQAGGDLGYFVAEEMVKPFADAAFALEKGQYTKTPVQTEFGWHVILVEDKRERTAPAYEELKGEIQNQLSQDVIESKIKELRSTADIELFNQDGTPAGEEPAEPAAAPAEPDAAPAP